jgi:phosphoribosyl 1,2-cyclic phosphodiesterase
MQVVSLQSGSNGNCIFVRTGGARLLFDAGISGKQAAHRLRATTGEDIRDVDALFISHDHVDHVRSAGVFQRKFGLRMLATEATLDASRRHKLGVLGDVATFRTGQAVRVGDAIVQTIPTPHDGVDGCCFVVEAGGDRLGILTDLGEVFDELPGLLETLDAVVLESNYDPDMLADGPYPRGLQQRIRGTGGHLANHEAAELLARHGHRLRWAALGHLSEQNNSPRLARQTARDILGGNGWGDKPLHLASRYEPSELLST